MTYQYAKGVQQSKKRRERMDVIIEKKKNGMRQQTWKGRVDAVCCHLSGFPEEERRITFNFKREQQEMLR